MKEHYSAREQLLRKDLEPKTRTVKVGVSYRSLWSVGILCVLRCQFGVFWEEERSLEYLVVGRGVSGRQLCFWVGEKVGWEDPKEILCVLVR